MAKLIGEFPGVQLEQIRAEGRKKLKAEMEARLGHAISDNEVDDEAFRRGYAWYTDYMAKDHGPTGIAGD